MYRFGGTTSLLIAQLLILQSNQSPLSNNLKIVGGEIAEPHQFPYSVALICKKETGSYFCAGSLISPEWVLTAAHCVDKNDGIISITTILGAHDFKNSEEPGQIRVESNDFFTHENWRKSGAYEYDIGLINIDSVAVYLSEQIQYVALPSTSDRTETFEGSLATISGWGHFSDNNSSLSQYLNFVESTIITNSKCSGYYFGMIKASQICMAGDYGKSACKGDSGGPLVVFREKKPYQVGIVSFGISGSCERGYPSVYTRVTSYLDWIYENMYSSNYL